MKKNLYNAFRLLRPRQWIKNFALFAPIIFTGELFTLPILEKVIWAFVVFCLASSAIYIINDMVDVNKDRLHPFKRFRPLANKDISLKAAFILAVVLTVLSLFISSFLPTTFLILIIIYLLLQLGYSAFLKHIAVLDILTIAAGYILRVYAGEFASGLHISVWLLLTTISVSLFLAVGKRRSELTLVSKHAGEHMATIRQTLSHYSERLLDVYASMFATATFILYALFTFQEEPMKPTLGLLMPHFLPDWLARKWLMITIIPVVYGLMRYLQDIYEKHEGESPEKVIISDKPLLICVIIWALLVIGIVYLM